MQPAFDVAEQVARRIDGADGRADEGRDSEVHCRVARSGHVGDHLLRNDQRAAKLGRNHVRGAGLATIDVDRVRGGTKLLLLLAQESTDEE